MKNMILALLVIFFAAGCNKNATHISNELSSASKQFMTEKRIVVYDSVQGRYLLSIEGRCSAEKVDRDNELKVICKTSETEYKKNIVGLSNNIGYFVEHIKDARSNVYHYKVMPRPQALVSDIDLEYKR